MSNRTAILSTLGRRLGLALVACLAVTGTALALPTGSALAHNTVVDSVPAEGQVLTELPAEFAVTTNDTLLSASAAIQVTDASGAYYGDGCVTIDGPRLATLASLGEPGGYTLTWQAVSADGHPIDGVISFTWDPSGEFTPATGTPAAPVCGQTEAETPPATEQGQDEASEPPAAPEEEGLRSEDAVFSWILGGAIFVILAVGAVLLLTRRRDS